MKHAYHNTANAGQRCIEFDGKSIKQEDVILESFQKRDEIFSLGWSPSQLFNLLSKDGRNWPLTSIRRAISNLTRDGKLIKTDKKCKGLYGRDEFIWRVVL